MAPKNSTTDAEPKKKSESPSPATGGKTYRELITEGIIASNSRKGATRPALKKYIREHYKTVGESPQFDHYFNQALKKGVAAGEFKLPKGPSGTVKLAKRKSASPSPSAAGSKASKVTKPGHKKGTTTAPAKKSSSPASTARTKAKTTKTGTDDKAKTKATKTKAKPKTKADVATASAKAKIRSKSKVRTSKSSSSSSSSGLTYREMIIRTILKLNRAKGASRIALKKEIKNQYADKLANIKNFDHYFNAALKKAVENGDLRQPKGPSGVIKVLRKGERSVSA